MLKSYSILSLSWLLFKGGFMTLLWLLSLFGILPELSQIRVGP